MPMNERCRDCKAPAAYRCEAREVGERQKIKKGGIEQIVQPYLTFFVCEPCCRKVVASGDPPRRVTPLPHEKERLKELAG